MVATQIFQVTFSGSLIWAGVIVLINCSNYQLVCLTHRLLTICLHAPYHSLLVPIGETHFFFTTMLWGVYRTHKFFALQYIFISIRYAQQGPVFIFIFYLLTFNLRGNAPVATRTRFFASTLHSAGRKRLKPPTSHLIAELPQFPTAKALSPP